MTCCCCWCSISHPFSLSSSPPSAAVCITFNLQSQYELYLTRTWSPTPAPMTLLEFQPQGLLAAGAQAPGGGGGMLSGMPTQSVVYKCPSSVNCANPQLNIQLPQYYRHSTIDSCSPVKYNQLLAAPQIILSRDPTATTYPQQHFYGTLPDGLVILCPLWRDWVISLVTDSCPVSSDLQ